MTAPRPGSFRALRATRSPELREAVVRLAAERDRLRDELAGLGKIASLERLADEDALTPVANRRLLCVS